MCSDHSPARGGAVRVREVMYRTIGAELGGQRLQALHPPRGKPEPPALGRQLPGERLANAGGRANDDGAPPALRGVVLGRHCADFPLSSST